MNMNLFFERKKLCDACSARKDARQVVVPVLSMSKVWILGRNPGRDEDVAGHPFVGRGGNLLDIWLDILGYPRSFFFIENPVACYTKDDRPPVRDEKKACLEWLKQELDLLRPVLVVALGNDALQVMVLDEKVSVTNMHGTLLPSKFFGARVFPMFHPGHALRDPHIRDLVEKDDPVRGYECDLTKLRKVLKYYESYPEGRKELEHFDRR